MPTGLIRLITTQKVLKTWSVKGMKQHYLGSNQAYHSSVNTARHEINVATEDTYVMTIPRQIQLTSVVTFSKYVAT